LLQKKKSNPCRGDNTRDYLHDTHLFGSLICKSTIVYLEKFCVVSVTLEI
jgi:hypothetical protein